MPANAQGRGFEQAGLDGRGFVPSPDLLAEIVEAYNQRTRDVAEREGVPLVDLARAFAEDEGCPSCFYDQWHFTAEGAARAAELMAAAIKR